MPRHLDTQCVLPDEAPDLPEIMGRCVAALPERYGTVITLYYLNGVSYDEIAGIMNIPLGTLKAWMFRARKLLRKALEHDFAERNNSE